MEKYVYAVLVLLFLGAGFFVIRKKSGDNLPEGLILLPSFFKPIGIVWALTSFVLAFILDFNEIEIWKTLASHSINLGLFMVCFSKDKLEDELTNSVRLHAFYTSVTAGFIFLIIIHFLDFLLGNTDFVYPARQLITIILTVYAFSYASLKRKMFYGK